MGKRTLWLVRFLKNAIHYRLSEDQYEEMEMTLSELARDPDPQNYRDEYGGAVQKMVGNYKGWWRFRPGNRIHEKRRGFRIVFRPEHSEGENYITVFEAAPRADVYQRNPNQELKRK